MQHGGLDPLFDRAGNAVIELQTQRLRLRQWRWRLARIHWGRGFATEAARAALRVGFERLALPEIVSFTAARNLRSRAVMERVGMRNAQQDFEHPGVPEGNPLRTHCLYRLGKVQGQVSDAQGGQRSMETVT